MTNNFKNMLYLFAASSRGIKAQVEGKLDIEEIRRLAKEQGIWTVVYPELAKFSDASKYQMEFFALVSKGIAQKEFTLGIIKKIEEKGIPCCLLKGASVAHLYHDPECRISSDTDILINPDDEEKLKNVLLELGYGVEKRMENDHHLKAYHKNGGLLEAHIMLYSKTSQKFLFNGLDMYSGLWATMNINGYDYHILGINDGLIYLTAHYIKHLVNEGGGVRQMMDLLLYMEKYRDEIDFESYEKILKELSYDKLLDVIKTIGAKYFGFNYEIKDEDLADKILTDSEMGGIFGFETDTRKNFYDSYCEKRTTMSKYQHKIYMSMNYEFSFFDKVFPQQKVLVNVYGIKYARNKWLLPVAWVHRNFKLVARKLFRKNERKKQDTAEFKERMQLMRDLNMIK